MGEQYKCGVLWRKEKKVKFIVKRKNAQREVRPFFAVPNEQVTGTLFSTIIPILPINKTQRKERPPILVSGGVLLRTSPWDKAPFGH